MHIYLTKSLIMNNYNINKSSQIYFNKYPRQISIFKSILFSAFIIFGFVACDQIKPPYEENNIQPTDTTTKTVLLEEYTGFRCGNCPAAAEISHQIKAKYGDKVVVMAIHVGSLAMPTPQHKYDFRTTTGNELDDYFKIGWEIGTPNGLIDRIPYNGSLVLGETTWEAALLARMKEKAKMTLKFENANFNLSENTISTQLKIKFIEKGLANYNIAIYIVEDSVVNYQTDYRLSPPDILDYVHNNTLRGAITSTWGVPISDTDISAGTEITKDFSYSLPENIDWRMNWVRLVAVITNSETKEVLQVSEKYLNTK